MSYNSQTITLAAMRARIARVVDRFGADYSPKTPSGETGCTYARIVDGVLTAECLIGQVFADMGLLGLLTYDPLSLMDQGVESPHQMGSCSAGERMWDHLADLGIDVDTDARTYARTAQRGQDTGLTWGRALDYADAVVLFAAASAARSALGLDNYIASPEPEDFFPDADTGIDFGDGDDGSQTLADAEATDFGPLA